jgi:hypothetical protein
MHIVAASGRGAPSRQSRHFALAMRADCLLLPQSWPHTTPAKTWRLGKFKELRRQTWRLRKNKPLFHVDRKLARKNRPKVTERRTIADFADSGNYFWRLCVMVPERWGQLSLYFRAAARQQWPIPTVDLYFLPGVHGCSVTSTRYLATRTQSCQPLAVSFWPVFARRLRQSSRHTPCAVTAVVESFANTRDSYGTRSVPATLPHPDIWNMYFWNFRHEARIRAFLEHAARRIA